MLVRTRLSETFWSLTKSMHSNVGMERDSDTDQAFVKHNQEKQDPSSYKVCHGHIAIVAYDSNVTISTRTLRHLSDSS